MSFVEDDFWGDILGCTTKRPSFSSDLKFIRKKEAMRTNRNDVCDENLGLEANFKCELC